MNWYRNMPPVDFSARHDVLIENADGTLTPMDEPYFCAEPLADGVWQILSDGDYCYLVAGTQEALVIDSGYGCGDLRAFCRRLCGRPVDKVANTHFHFDHTANNYLFDIAYMSQESVGRCSIPSPSFSGIDFPRDYPFETITEGDTFALGDLILEVYTFSDHAQGSLAFLDRKHRLLFSGDELVAENYRIRSTFSHSYEMLLKFKALQPYYDRLCAGPGIFPASLVDEYLAAFDALRSDPSCAKPMLPPFPPTPAPDGRHRAVYPRRLARSCDLWLHPEPDFEEKREFIYRNRRIEFWRNRIEIGGML